MLAGTYTFYFCKKRKKKQNTLALRYIISNIILTKIIFSIFTIVPPGKRKLRSCNVDFCVEDHIEYKPSTPKDL